MSAAIMTRNSPKLSAYVSFILLALVVPAWGRSEPEAIPDGLALLERVAKQYADLRTYKITKQESFSSEHPPDPAPKTFTAFEAPGGRYWFEGDVGLGKAVQVSGGAFILYYRSAANAYIRRLLTNRKPDLPKVLFPDETAIRGAAGLHDMTWLGESFKSARRLPDEKLTLNGHEFECSVVVVTNGDRKIPFPYPFTGTLWIEKGSFKVRKIVELYITTLNQPASAPITYPATTTSLYPEVVLNEPIPDSAFQFTPPATAHLVGEFPGRPAQIRLARPAGRKAPDVTFISVNGSQARLEDFRGQPVLLDLWATWCGPCIEGFPDIAAIYERTRATGLVILSVDEDDDPKVAQAYLDKMHYPWRNFSGRSEEIYKAFGVGAIPRTIIIDSKGEIAFDKVSPAKQDILAAIAALGPQYTRALEAR